MEPTERLLPIAAELPACDERIAGLHRYWRGLWPAADTLPGRQHFDPLAIPALLPWIRLYDVHRGPLRFRYRLFGTELVRMIGSDPTGLWLAETFPHMLQSASYRGLCRIAEGGFYSFARGTPLNLPAHDHIEAERILLPLARDGRDVDIVLGMTALLAHEALPKPVPAEA
jgi:hypothetical protein